MIKHKCNKCGAILESLESMTGREDVCPICRQKFIVIQKARSSISGKIIVAGSFAVGLLIVISFSLGATMNSQPSQHDATESKYTEPSAASPQKIIPKPVKSGQPVIATKPQKLPETKPIPVIAPKPNLQDAQISSMRKVLIQMQLDLNTLPSDFAKDVEFFACDLNKLIAKWEAIIISDCPVDFQNAFKELIAVTKAMADTFAPKNLVDASDSDYRKNAFAERARASALRWKSCIIQLEAIARKSGVNITE